MFKGMIAACAALFCAASAQGACAPPNGSYGGVIPGISFSSDGATSGAYLQMVKLDIRFSRGRTNPFGASSFYVFYTTLNSSEITNVGTVPVVASTWDAANCIGSLTMQESSTPFHFISTSSGSTLMGFSPSAGSDFEWAWGRLEKI